MVSAVISGSVVGESLRDGVAFEPTHLRVTRVERLHLGDGAVGQPARWTVVHFEGADGDADDIATELATCLRPDGGWYADFSTANDHVVVFADTVFRYRKGDAEGRRAAVEHGRAVGVPDGQLDWKD